MEEQQFQRIENALNKEIQSSTAQLKSFLSTALKKLEDRSTLDLVVKGSKRTAIPKASFRETNSIQDSELARPSATDRNLNIAGQAGLRSEANEKGSDTGDQLEDKILDWEGPFPMFSFLQTKETGIVDTVVNRLANLNVPSLNVELVVRASVVQSQC
eukprot:Gregarina_sp_Poly_1__3564@NODE_2041_length_2792_cov_18_341284_g1317_i0_p2_GENE_NODE_2041_length_2792_cov_18_341284_g1317_i0NODE_2041_length_2792_cov_18_341284_g1317_i0_p2_ORF_typecomplete_len158_score23_16DUF2199/PF09965_9/0_016_NODE_2041_length_2792_cov_18_341284_g1317_i014561929